jgi:putative transposase
MTEYRRAWVPGGTWFFTVNLAERRGNRLLVEGIDLLRTAFHTVRLRHPFRLDAVVILPDHFTASGRFLLAIRISRHDGP